MGYKHLSTVFIVLCMCLLIIQCDDDSKNDNNDSPMDGTTVGCRAMNFTLVDQNNNPVSLHDYMGKVILLDIATMW